MRGLFLIAWREDNDREWYPHALYTCDICADKDFHGLISDKDIPDTQEYILFDVENIQLLNRSTGTKRSCIARPW